MNIRFSFLFADDLSRKRLSQLYKPPTPEMLAYLDFSVSTTGMLTGVKVNNSNYVYSSLHATTIMYSTSMSSENLDDYCSGDFRYRSQPSVPQAVGRASMACYIEIKALILPE